ncbi:sulfatase-like hydrolase/transferase [Calycomorphotria hydatis]|uniref:Sulfatase n=1 Tax=Calycomorphotria hydatis TaxID=2528027 RepID=A0A517T7G8_9PLAN|nr:sulfatase-like hydrolase/transferase [Calycomorphotria hydatis]QDT64324.1 Sulfatase [Calycomorphotria hydatis]
MRMLTGWMMCLFLVLAATVAAAADRPNILWLTSEDNGPHLGCYGDEYADTPNIDKLASEGVIYSTCWSNAPVCAPARTTIISGMFAISTGGQHMRSYVPMPEGASMYPVLLKENGYFVSNWKKEDYNLAKPEGQLWDSNKGKYPWRDRKKGQPFFSIMNFTISHESQIRKRPHTLVHDPAKAPVADYHPDLPEVRHDWAQYYDKLTEMDRQVGDALKQLKEDGLEEDTIVFYYGDHGSGMPRSKRWPYNSGLHVPLVIRIPEKYRDLYPGEYVEGGRTDRLVGFVDLAPTLMSLIDIEPPDYMQGKAFLGTHVDAAKEYLIGYRGRMDERYDMIRSITDGRYVYVRNFMPQRIYGQHVSYMFQTPTTQVWQRDYKAGKLSPPKTYFWEKKPFEELYDLTSDPHEVNNLADDPKLAEVKQKLSSQLRNELIEIRDVGFLSEAEMHARADGDAPYDMGHDPKRYPMEKILSAAETATRVKEGDTSELLALISDPDSAVRYWAVMGLQIRETGPDDRGYPQLAAALEDENPSVRVLAAETLAHFGTKEDKANAVELLINEANYNTSSFLVSIAAMNVLDQLGGLTDTQVERIREVPDQVNGHGGRYKNYIQRLKSHLITTHAGSE